MRREDKSVLATVVIVHVADLFDDWNAAIARFPTIDGMDREDARRVVAHWMAKLPGHGWDNRLPEEDFRS